MVLFFLPWLLWYLFFSNNIYFFIKKVSTKNMKVNLYNLHFSFQPNKEFFITLLFHLLNQTIYGKIKIFFYPFTIFYLFTFTSSSQMNCIWCFKPRIRSWLTPHYQACSHQRRNWRRREVKEILETKIHVNQVSSLLPSSSLCTDSKY